MMKFEGTLDALRARQARATTTIVDTSDNARAAAAASAMGVAARVVDGRLVSRALPRDGCGRLIARLVAEGLDVYEIATPRVDLEEIFLDLIGGAE